MSAARCLWMVCYKTSPDSYQTYWGIYPAASEQEATNLARRDGLLDRVQHRWTVPYNKAGMTVEQTYSAYLGGAA